MSWEDENIDKLFQETSENISFEFKEEYWSEMEAMLPKKKRRFPFIWFFSGTAVIVVLTVIFFSAEDTTLSKKSNYFNPKIDNSFNLTPKKPTQNLTKNKVILAKEQQEINQINFDKNESNSYIDKNIKGNTNIYFNKKVNHPINSKLKGEIKTTNQITEDPTKNTLTKIYKSSEEIVKNDAVNTVDALNRLNFPSNQYDHSLIPGPLFTPHSSHWLVFFDCSTTMGQSMIHSNSTGSNISKGFGLSSGINYSTKSWSFTTGVSASLTLIDNLLVRERVKIYGFGVQNYDNIIAYNHLYTFEIPFMVGYKQKNHILQFGIVPSILIGSKISYESKTNDEVIASSTLFGYRKGLTNFGLKPTIGYLYKITPSLQIGANLQIQLCPSIQEDLFEGVKNKFPINGQFFIRKSIFLK